MTIYLDTSSLVKLLIEEAGSLDVLEQVEQADLVVTLSLTYTEARSALARRLRERKVSPRAHAEGRRALEETWAAMVVVGIDDDLCRRAGEMVDQYRLRAYDSLHLAAYESIARDAAPEPAMFSSADVALNRAAAAVARRLR